MMACAHIMMSTLDDASTSSCHISMHLRIGGHDCVEAHYCYACHSVAAVSLLCIHTMIDVSADRARSMEVKTR
jgi:hypothetical protein